jgi:DNA-binding LacI/PurR family transcriptional regulator
VSKSGLREHLLVIDGGPESHDGRRAAADLLTLTPQPTAVIAYNDERAWA